MKKFQLITLLMTLILTNSYTTNAQCTWRSFLTDGYEYTTVVPGLIPGTTIHSTPQSYAVHTGAKSLYMNFVNTLPAGALVYERTVPVCANVPIRISTWITTTFSGVQCNMHFQIVDSNNVVLTNTDSVLAAYAPQWTQYQSGAITPTTPIVKFRMYSNIGGSQTGNDLSVDDFFVEQCQSFTLGTDTTICNLNTLLLNAGNYSTFLWNNNTTNQTLLAHANLGGTSTETYWVLVTDSNGCSFRDTVAITFVPCASVNAVTNENRILLYPNPATDYLTIIGFEKNSTIVLYNMVGEKIKALPYQEKLFVGDVAKGIYFLKLETTTGQKFVQKILIE